MPPIGKVETKAGSKGIAMINGLNMVGSQTEPTLRTGRVLL